MGKNKKIISIIVIALIIIGLLIYMVMNTSFNSFKIENSDYNMLNKDNFVNLTVEKLCDDCETKRYEEAKSINDYDQALDLVEMISSAKRIAKEEDETLEIPQYMVVITYAKEEEEITYTYAITIAITEDHSFWLYLSEKDEFYKCTITKRNLLEYIENLYDNN